MFLNVLWGWEEGPLTDNIFFKVQKIIEGLKPRLDIPTW
jgi:hypothetical protein